MAIAETRTLLSLDQFAEVMGVSPFAINQLDINELNVTTDCEVWYQWVWQNNETITREVMAQAIAEAEQILATELGFWPAPKYTLDEKISYPRPYKAEYWDVWYNERWKLKSVRTKYGKFWAPGAPVYEVISASSAVTRSDRDGDGVDDWFSVGPIATTATEECEIGVYFIDADRPVMMPMAEEQWRIRPVKVEISGGNVTISGPLWRLVDPDLIVAPGVAPLDPTAAATFVSNLKVQRRYTDSTDQGICSLEHVVCYGEQCSNIEVDACFGERSAERGVVIPEATENSWPLGAPDTCCGSPYYAPDYVQLNYLSGHALNESDGMCRVDHLMAQMIARLAVTLLPDRQCAECSGTQIDFWRDLPTEDETDALTEELASNPLGITRGALWVWRHIHELNANQRVGAII